MSDDGQGPAGDGDGDGGSDRTGGEHTAENVPERFDRLPATATGRAVAGRPSRAAVLEWFEERFGVPHTVFEGYSLWERGKGKIWVLAAAAEPEPDAVDVEALGMTVLRTRQEHWKPTMAGVQRFGGHATRNVLELDRQQARRFLAGEEQELGWDGDWGYLIVAHEIAGEPEPLGVGLYTYGTLRSQVPKGRRREL
jgi:NOL1/NOP2/fmu family ribosome biogenesis protein